MCVKGTSIADTHHRQQTPQRQHQRHQPTPAANNALAAAYLSPCVSPVAAGFLAIVETMHELTPAPLDSVQVTGPNMAAFWPIKNTEKKLAKKKSKKRPRKIAPIDAAATRRPGNHQAFCLYSQTPTAPAFYELSGGLIFIESDVN